MRFEISHKSGKPPFLQIVEQVQRAVAGGTLQPGARLPSLRDLAMQLRVNRNTVARAYNELEHLGVVESQQGLGVFVTHGGSRLSHAARMKEAREAMDAAIVQARHLGLSDEDFIQLAQTALKDFNRNKGGK